MANNKLKFSSCHRPSVILGRPWTVNEFDCQCNMSFEKSKTYRSDLGNNLAFRSYFPSNIETKKSLKATGSVLLWICNWTSSQ